MSFFAASLLHKFLLFTFLLGLLHARSITINVKSIFLQSVGAIFIGGLLSLYLPSSLLIRLSISVFECILIVFILLTFLLPKHFSILCALWQVLLLTLASYLFFLQPEILLITSASVLNTALILNVSALIFAVFLLVLCQLSSYKMSKFQPKLGLFFGLLILFLWAFSLSGQLLLSMMKLHVATLTSLRLSFASKSIYFTEFVSYSAILFLCVFSVRYHFKFIAPLVEPLKTLTAIKYRHALAQYYQKRRLLRLTVLTLLLCLSSLLFWDLYASRPASLSASTFVTLESDDAIHLDIKKLELGSGKLYRFIWVASDGKAIRFFVINRYKDQLKLGVVFDACLLCGDKGYVQKGNQVICLACGVRIFIPSIGKVGGCNPIPMQFTQDATEVRISKESLLQGYQYFTQTLEIEVWDPVAKIKLLNTKASSQYKYKGKTWFFINDANYTHFRDDPERYLENTASATGDK
ncbi:integral membrane protein [Psychromonas sp. CNPT3]|uniref:Fe-S-containing protein n=1 Tax=Psychromonas sp. CNPT3 TaxID=314282 RepID=UPI00006E9E58|nr:Fe-S-containing protein [Psychromonas sp. CNPT3]AGH82366.1 integral membrane protein [Psychromonas sp. CNPT3]